MNIGSNLAFLRKQKKMTQEQLAERLGVSRQTVSRWETDEVVPELAKLNELCGVFSCRLDALVNEDMQTQEDIFSAVVVRRVAPFRMARYVIVSPNPEDDVQQYMDNWARRSGLLTVRPDAVKIGWDFPYISQEQQTRFGLHGYVCAYVLPEGFSTDVPGVEYEQQEEADYAVITVTEPFIAPFERIPAGYRRVMEYIGANGFREKPRDRVLPCFEHEYEKNGTSYMDIYVAVDSVTKTDVFTNFS